MSAKSFYYLGFLWDFIAVVMAVIDSSGSEPLVAALIGVLSFGFGSMIEAIDRFNKQ